MKFLSAPKNEQFIEYLQTQAAEAAEKFELYETDDHFLYIELDPEADELIEIDTGVVINLVVHSSMEFGFAVSSENDVFYSTKHQAYSSDLLLLADYINDDEHDLEYLNDHTLFVTDRTGFVNIKRFSGKSLQLVDDDTVIISKPNNRSKAPKAKALTQMFQEIGITSGVTGKDLHKDLLRQLDL